ncbi:hypothetical protein HPOKI154_04550 [Helicobacter pylori oki154]|nr:hypothetical protein HPOKI154_04550 [Helicobacter pylori oki154]
MWGEGLVKTLFSLFSEWKTSAIILKKRYFIGGLIFFFADFSLTLQKRFLIFRFSFF